MAKPDTSKWPWDNRPSSKHRFKVVFQNGSEFGEKCQRCGCYYNTRSGGTAPMFCYPTFDWMMANPTDDGLLGESRTPFG
jgi:hypothetical protein